MKANKHSHSALFSYLCIPAFLAVSISSSASLPIATASSMQATTIMNQQEADADKEELSEKAGKPAEVIDQAAEDEKRKKYCATARKNLELLRSNMNETSFTTDDGKIVRYTPAELQKMIKDSEAAEKANCD